MKSKDCIKLINIIKNTDKEALQKLITEKVSRIVSEQSNTKNS